MEAGLFAGDSGLKSFFSFSGFSASCSLDERKLGNKGSP
jgi:hypothetical protein